MGLSFNPAVLDSLTVVHNLCFFFLFFFFFFLGFLFSVSPAMVLPGSWPVSKNEKGWWQWRGVAMVKNGGPAEVRVLGGKWSFSGRGERSDTIKLKLCGREGKRD
ncbi:hypothetical protein L1049_018656 [Liquidambar formosana]|uniref:Uncharacterized protein n=1 Tax=Liquidambar formosana TaxID=63359 RepID=A0AAP0RAE0_LIQFO